MDKKSCKEEAKKYSSRYEFLRGSNSAYFAAWRNKWLDDYSWFKEVIKWTYEKCKEEAKKYSTKKEFREKSGSAYNVALKNKWLYDWFEKRFLWTKEKCYEEAEKYSTKIEFLNKNRGAYRAAQRNNWLDDYDWLRKGTCSFKNDHIYSYEFTDLKAVYVGRTVQPSIRNKDHKKRKDTVSSFAKEHNIPIPKMKILEKGITVNEGSVKEGMWLEKYEKEGWIILNKAKTGGIGSFSPKRTYEKCYEEAKKYTTKKEFRIKSSGAYNAACRKKWLCDYDWLINKPHKWTYENCKNEAKKYFSRNEFQKGNRYAYREACDNHWLDDFFGERVIWTYEKCKEEVKKYSSRKEFREKSSSAYNASYKNHWLDEFFPKSL